ncbi:MAG: tetratricopeptide repeat protein, partial [Pseudomonadota bacterium]
MCALSVPWGEAARRAFALALPLLLIGCQTTGDQQSTGGAAVPIASLPTGSAVTPEDLFIVDCLLPGQARRLGTGVTYVAARRAIKAPAYDCARRGGEYVLPGQATQLSALDRWLPVARAGDAEAQAYVGEIHERGIDRAPNLAEAARWYALAADQGNTRAMVNLAALYESGTGVPQDRDRAVELYAEAAGLDVASFRQASAAAAEPVVIRSRTVVEVPVADPALERENARLAAELAAAQGALA